MGLGFLSCFGPPASFVGFDSPAHPPLQVLDLPVVSSYHQRGLTDVACSVFPVLPGGLTALRYLPSTLPRCSPPARSGCWTYRLAGHPPAAKPIKAMAPEPGLGQQPGMDETHLAFV
jgi:hypothetical protein